MADHDVQVNIRMPSKLKAALEREAVGNGRSLTAEVVRRLVRSFSPAPGDEGLVLELLKRSEEESKHNHELLRTIYEDGRKLRTMMGELLAHELPAEVRDRIEKLLKD